MTRVTCKQGERGRVLASRRKGEHNDEGEHASLAVGIFSQRIGGKSLQSRRDARRHQRKRKRSTRGEQNARSPPTTPAAAGGEGKGGVVSSHPTRRPARPPAAQGAAWGDQANCYRPAGAAATAAAAPAAAARRRCAATTTAVRRRRTALHTDGARCWLLLLLNSCLVVADCAWCFGVGSASAVASAYRCIVCAT